MVVTFFRSLVAVAIVGGLILHSGKAFFPAPRLPLVIRGGLGTLAFLCLIYATQRLPLTISGVLIWCTPVVTYVTARLVLKESLSLATGLWLALAMSGLVLIVSPSWLQGETHEAFNLYAFTVGLGGTVMAGIVFNTIRSASAKHNNNSIVMSLSLATLIVSTVALPFYYQQPTVKQLTVLLVLGVSGTFAQLALTEAYRNGSAALVSSLSLMQAPFSIFWGLIIFAETMSLLHIVGVLIMGMGITFAVRHHAKD